MIRWRLLQTPGASLVMRNYVAGEKMDWGRKIFGAVREACAAYGPVFVSLPSSMVIQGLPFKETPNVEAQGERRGHKWKKRSLLAQKTMTACTKPASHRQPQICLCQNPSRRRLAARSFIAAKPPGEHRAPRCARSRQCPAPLGPSGLSPRASY